MQPYVIIDQKEHYRIYQQVNGKAEIHLTGRVQRLPEDVRPGAVYACLFRESDGAPVTKYVRAESAGERWKATLRDVPAGGPYTLRTKYSPDGNAECMLIGESVRHLGVGDLWVIAGQSNASGYGNTPVGDVPDPRVHLYSIGHTWREGAHPLSDDTDWESSVIGEGFITGYSPFVRFASALARELGYPIGLLQTSQGGSPLVPWEKGQGMFQYMIDVIRAQGGRVRGIAWYQGCSDTDSREGAESYLSRFEGFVRDVRAELACPKLPFLTVQLNKTTLCAPEQKTHWALIKEAQRQAALRIANLWVIPSHDMGLSDWIHNDGAGNVILGQRLAWAALEHVYGRPVFGTAPMAEEVRCQGDTVTVRFAPVVFWLVHRNTLPETCDFIVEDDAGPVPLTGYTPRNEGAELKLGRLPQGQVYVSFAPFPLNSWLLPFDRGTGMPPLAFYRYPAAGGEGGHD